MTFADHDVLKWAGRRFLALGRDEDGAALVITLAMFMLMFFSCIAVYSISIAVREKVHLQNAVDAAAYSAAVVQADTLSRIATINRAMAWTYVDMSRRQLDYIVYRWLSRVRTVYNEDLGAVRDWNRLGVFCSLGCNRHHHSGVVRADTCWCGADEAHIGQVRINSWASLPLPLHYVSMDAISSALNTFPATLTAARIVFDKSTIVSMNVAEVDLANGLSKRIDGAVKNVLKANVPSRWLNEVSYYLRQAGGAWTDGNHLSYMRYLNNTRQDEKQFCGFVWEDDYNREPYEVMRGNGWLYNVMGIIPYAYGTDRWFVRGDGSRRARNSDVGIQRSYKHWEEDSIWSLGLYPTKYVEYQGVSLPPSAFNFNSTENEASHFASYDWLAKPLPSIGLSADWKWYSMIWSCHPVPTFTGVRWRHKEIQCKLWCDHSSLDFTISRGRNCIPLPNPDIKHWHGHSRVYGDDPLVYDSMYYVGAKCLPLILRNSYFGSAGTISVGLMRRNRNVWLDIMSRASGIFSGFDPVVGWTSVFASAKAGFKDPNDVNPYDRSYIVDWRGEKTGKWYWNLCQDDWDAVMVPVRRAESSAVSGVWSYGNTRFLSSWVGDTWKPLGYGTGIGDWVSLRPPPGMWSPGNLDWGGVADAIYH